MKIVSGISDGQVLQRLGKAGANVVLEITEAIDGPVHVTIAKGATPLKSWKRRVVGKAVKGKLTAKLVAIPVGGPYRLRVEAGSEKVEIASFFVGDVWILAGQSNMEGVGNMTGAAKPHPLVRAFSMRREWRLATEPLHVIPESPDSSHVAVQLSVKEGERFRSQAVKGVGPGLYFAKEMLERSGGVPQALICTAHGGTSMLQWDPAKKNLGGGSLYGSMLLSVEATGQPVAGLLWYQGESDANAENTPLYTSRMKKLVAASRRDLGLPRLPWVIVQLGRHFAVPQPSAPWNDIQEQQRLLPEKIAYLDTVPAVDLPLDDGIHIGGDGYPLLATRLASAADRLVYGNKHETRGPQLRKRNPIQRVGAAVIDVAFDHVRGGLQAPGQPVGFQIVDANGEPFDMIFRIELRGNVARLYLYTALGSTGLQLYYGHGRAPICNITDARGFSLPMFGPLPLDSGPPVAVLPFVTQWSLTSVVPAAKKLDRVSIAQVKALPATPKIYPPSGFIDEHASWVNQAGQCFFHSRILLSEPMNLVFLMGYDGPFRLWLNDRPFFVNMKGINPCYADESTKSVRLPAGTHDIRVGMDLNGGRAWGFFLRFGRKDVTKEQIKSGLFAKPVYLG
jgi:sialate O-acetylesterase